MKAHLTLSLRYEFSTGPATKAALKSEESFVRKWIISQWPAQGVRIVKIKVKGEK